MPVSIPPVFISYAHEDIAMVRSLHEDLQVRKIITWFDKVDLRPGFWEEQIQTAISKSRYFLFCISNSVIRKTNSGGGFVDKELDYAIKIAISQSEDNFTIIPIRLEHCELDDKLLSKFQHYDLFEDWELVVDKLASHLTEGYLNSTASGYENSQRNNEIENLTGRAQMLEYAGHFNEALKSWHKLTSVNPGSSEPWYSQGRIYLKVERYPEAYNAFSGSLQIDPSLAEAWLGLGYAYNGTGQFENALKAIDKAIELKQGLTVAWQARIIILHNLGYHDAARDTCAHAQQLGIALSFE